MKKALLKYVACLLSAIVLQSTAGFAQQVLSLAGKWTVALDPDSAGYRENWSLKTFNQSIQLPGTTDEAHLGTKTSGSDYGILTRAYKYVGPAWYQRTITIPASWKNRAVTLFLERVLWESKVYVDGKEVSAQSPLYVPHLHNLGVLTPGRHTLTICVNNELIHNIGDKGHGYTEYTQSIWNGIVGRLELRKQPPVAITGVALYPDAAARQLALKLSLRNVLPAAASCALDITLREKLTGKLVKQMTQQQATLSGNQAIDVVMKDIPGIKTWNEFNPALYTVTVQARQGNEVSTWTETTGFRKVSTNTHKVLVNDKVTYLRGNLDCVHFPLTGYPSCKQEDWEAIFKKYKDYGLNTVRFHSWCPPEAAFAAADKLGIYIQAEIIWIDWWMTTAPEDRPEMDTKGHPEGLGKNPSADAFVQAEMKRILDAYGNHPSFMMFCIGNELGNSDFDVMAQWIDKAKKYDPRRLYAVSTARKITGVDDYSVTHNIPNVGGTYGLSLNKTDAGLEKNYSRATLPIIAHEVGQFPVYPEWKEIDKYTGVLKARNLQLFRDTAAIRGLEKQDRQFHAASGALQTLLYKNLIENIQLAPSSAGYQLLSMQDYQGQGEALVGWLDAFWGDKGIAVPKKVREYANAVVPLIRTNSFTYTTSDTIHIGLAIANNYQDDIRKPLVWEVADEQGVVLKSGKAAVQAFPQGVVTEVGKVELPGSAFPAKAAVYTFRLRLADGSYGNSWQFYVVPRHAQIDAGKVLVTAEWNDATQAVLDKGGSVLLLAHKLGTIAQTHPINFTPLFWSTSFFPGQSNETLGSYIVDSSAAFRHFPTRHFTDWQWYAVSGGGRYFNLQGMPHDFRPLVQPISDFHINKKLGTLFETKVGNGKLLVCGYNLQQPDNAYAQQLYYSLLQYMNSPAFDPAYRLPEAPLRLLVAKTPVAAAVTLLPDGFGNASLFVRAGARASAGKPGAWEAGSDSVLLNSRQYKYTVTGANAVRSETAQGWRGRKMKIAIEPPRGVKGTIYLQLGNPGNAAASAIVTLDNREINTGAIEKGGKWIKVLLMREDTNDGKVELEIIADGNSAIDIKSLVIVEEE
ncbi:sugar-binding domain-containing protein [Paraflavitalea pollutisoli]|uniref:sugar-binding domain-containing protein n=1 Tax=Paraflavitalea pollutisoli TaxID=3034143 RepID=UPI0023EB3C79|nr:sugar-binding domain-containing protein [Paraflavitalea sp. H1-2-19X]